MKLMNHIQSEELNFVSLFCQLGKLGDWDT